MANNGFQSFADSGKYHARLSGIRSSRFTDFLQNGGSRVTRDDGNGDNAATGSFDFFAADNLVAGPIAAFYENIGQQPRDDLARRQLIENDDGVYGFESGKYFRPLAFGDDRPACAFQLADTGVAVQTDDEHVAELARQLEAPDVTGMEQVKAAVGEDDAAPVAFLAAKPQNRFFKCEN